MCFSCFFSSYFVWLRLRDPEGQGRQPGVLHPQLQAVWKHHARRTVVAGHAFGDHDIMSLAGEASLRRLPCCAYLAPA
jgi:hypothetical protein